MCEQDYYREVILSISDEISRPLWSVMIPTYNCAKYLRETLISVLAQDPGAELMQIEVIDDYSTKDDPQAVVEELGQGRVGFYRQPKNVGYIKNFNTCLQRSRGHLIHLLHGDDRVREGFYQKMQNAFKEHPSIGAAFCRNIGMSEDGHWEWISTLEQSESGILNNWLEQIAVFNRLQPPAMVVRRDVYEKIGGFDSRISCCAEDWEMWVRVATYYPVWYEVEPLVEYRGRVGSLTGNCRRTGQNVRDLRQIIDIIESYLPPDNARVLAQKARENWAIYVLQEIALPMLSLEQPSVAFKQIKEVYQLSLSLKIIRILIKFLIQAVKIELKKKLRQIVGLIKNPSRILENYIYPLILEPNVKHIYGLQEIDYAINELLVLSVVRNGEVYIKSFIEHYLQLGAKHIVFLDNGSNDETIAIAKQYKNVTILQTKCPYKRYETVMKRYLVNRFCRNKWNLFADIDELFDYPFSNSIGLNLFLDYLNHKSYTSVVVQMLDLFSATPLAELKSNKNDSLKDTYTYYDISNICKEAYPARFGGNSEKIELYWNGIRKTLFGSNNYLSKAALMFFNQRIVDTFVACHHVRNAHVADVTCVFLHYPFTSLFYEKVAEAVKSNRYAVSASQDYAQYWESLKQDPNLTIKQETASELVSINELVDQGFLVVSDGYKQWVKNHQKTEGF